MKNTNLKPGVKMKSQVNFMIEGTELASFKKAIERYNETAPIKGDQSSVLRMLVREFTDKQLEGG